MNDQLFNRAIAFWPKKIDVRKKTIYDNGGASIPKLTSVHDEIEEKILKLNDDMLSHMDWAIYTVLHISARKKDEIVISDIDQEEVFKYFQRNLEP